MSSRCRAGMTERQVTLIEDLRPDVIACTPSYALTLVNAFRERGIAPDEISLRYALVGAEPWTERMREEIDAGLGVRCSNIFGLSEVIGPGVSCECVEERAGSHVNEDHFLPEVVDPETGEPVAEGEEGVLVFTTLTKEALPLLRYWTGDICRLVRRWARNPARAAGRRCAWARSSGGATTCWSSAASTCTRARSAR